ASGEILCPSSRPLAAEPFHVVTDLKNAETIADSRVQKVQKQIVPTSSKVTLEELSEQIQKGEVAELRLVIKADVQGSVEAVGDALVRLSTEKVKVNVIHSGVGGITESDVMLASASGAIIIGFNVRPAGKADSLAGSEK